MKAAPTSFLIATGFILKKNLFDSVQLFFLYLVSYQKWEIKRSIFGILCLFITEKVRLFGQGKSYVKCMEKMNR